MSRNGRAFSQAASDSFSVRSNFSTESVGSSRSPSREHRGAVGSLDGEVGSSRWTCRLSTLNLRRYHHQQMTDVTNADAAAESKI